MPSASRLSQADRGLLILTSLASGVKHGYALMLDIEEFAGVKLGPGTLYGAIARLESTGMIEALEASDRRQPYRITANGRTELAQQLSENARIAKVGLRRLASAE